MTCAKPLAPLASLLLCLATATARAAGHVSPLATASPPVPATAGHPHPGAAGSGGVDRPAPRSALVRNISFLPSDEDIPNPERGFFGEVDATETDLTWYPHTTGNTVARLPARLDAYRHRDLPEAYLASLAAFFGLARQAGIKLIVRFAYNDGPYPDSEPDAPLSQVLRHIAQLGPILAANTDVIVWLEAGFIGAWGEWHTSTHGLDSPENRLAIRDALFAHFPPQRSILFRYPGDFIGWFPHPLTFDQAFGGSVQSRLGHHNDCFLASDDDEGTYLDADGVNRIREWQAYLEEMTRFVPMEGETCAPNPPRSSCATGLEELQLLHFSALNEFWHPEAIRSWKDQGCYPEIRRRLGYRLALVEAAFPGRIPVGQPLSLSVTLENTGFAAPTLARQAYLVWVGADGTAAATVPLPVDLRRWEPGVHPLSLALQVPVNLPAGRYTLALSLPDPAESLRPDPRYAIRLANQGIWDAARGWNRLGDIELLPPQQGRVRRHIRPRP